MRHALTGLVMLYFLLTPLPAAAQELSCPEVENIHISTDDPGSIVEICLAASQAIDFLAPYDLPPQRAIRFVIVDTPIDSSGYKAYGSYDSRSDEIRLMSYDAIIRSSAAPQMYGEPFDRVHYHGAIAHEVVHAIMQHNLTEKPISIGPQEYVAHATQLAVMPPARREALLKRLDVAAWESGDIISDVYMAIEPGKFAAKSYLHLTRMSNPNPFVQVLLNTKWFYVYVP